MNQPGVTDTRNSPYARLRTVAPRQVRLDEGFWRPWTVRNHERSLPALLEQLETHGVLDNFRRVSGRKHVARRGAYWTDSDLHKWIEAAAWQFQQGPDPELRRTFDAVVDDVLAAQGDDGYLNTYFVDREHDARFTRMHASHEFYCLGHLAQAAIALFRTTGETHLLDAVRRFADYLMTVFGPGKRAEASDHPELEMALVELYRATGEQRYLTFARFLLDRLDLFDQPQITGHAVCTAYACCGAADLVAETGDTRYRQALERLWQDMVRDKMYLTGGIGVRYFREEFGFPYELPSQYGYAETCAAIGNLMWNWRMLLLDGDMRYADLLERVLYNGFLAGVGLTGDLYFYQNPLASIGGYARAAWHECTCCPPNAERLLATVSSYFVTTSSEGLWFHLYDNCTFDGQLPGDIPLRAQVRTRYPFAGDIDIALDLPEPAVFTLFLRVPGWCPSAHVRFDSAPTPTPVQPGTYAALSRQWNPGDHVQLRLEMPVRLIAADTRLWDAAGRVAVLRGPLVYCLESPDNPAVLAARLWIDPCQPTRGLTAIHRHDLLGGLTVIEANGSVVHPDEATTGLYYEVRQGSLAAHPERLLFIPYYAWANRGDSQMTVWVPWEHGLAR